jgi:hypothetical protein
VIADEQKKFVSEDCIQSAAAVMAIASNDIKQIIATEDDFAYEMRVGRVLRGYLGSQTLQGGTYADPVSGKARQFDFRWLYQSGEFGLSLAIECKNVNPDSPVVISGRKRNESEAFHELVESRKGGRFRTNSGDIFLDVSAARVIRRITGNRSVYFPEAFVGKSLLQLKKKEGKYSRTRDTEVYEKWSQALASAVDLVQAAGRNATLATNQHVFTFVLPVVVLPDDSLWKIEYDINGKIIQDPQPANEIEFFVGHKALPPVELGDSTDPYVFSHLHFVTPAGFAALLLRITSDGEWLQCAFDEQVVAAGKAERIA